MFSAVVSAKQKLAEDITQLHCVPLIPFLWVQCTQEGEGQGPRLHFSPVQSFTLLGFRGSQEHQCCDCRQNGLFIGTTYSKDTTHVT